jgi:hypothetical protein
MTRITPEIEEAVRRDYVPGLFGYRHLQARYGISHSSIRRILSPEYEERQRILSRDAKRRRKGSCERCGAQTSYSGGHPPVSRLCPACASEEATIWTRERIIERVRDWAEIHGRPPTATDWRVGRGVWPPTGSVQKCFGLWADAIEAAGFPRPQAGGRYQERPRRWRYDRAEILRLLGTGMPQSEVASRVGCSRNLVSNLALRGTTAKVRT